MKILERVYTSFMNKKILLGVLAALLVIGSYVGSLYYRANVNPNAEIEANGAAWLAQEYANGAKINALEKLDTYGGVTPQETWKLFVTALEAGDTDLAAKYFVVEKQEEMKKGLALAKSNGVLETFLADFKTIEHENMSANGKEFTYITKPVKVEGIPNAMPYNYSLRFNANANLWKIYEL
jgi:hypothetical protein